MKKSLSRITKNIWPEPNYSYGQVGHWELWFFYATNSLSNDSTDAPWNQEVDKIQKLKYQPWVKPSVPSLSLRSAHNLTSSTNKDISAHIRAYPRVCMYRFSQTEIKYYRIRYFISIPHSVFDTLYPSHNIKQKETSKLHYQGNLILFIDDCARYTNCLTFKNENYKNKKKRENSIQF